MLFQAFKRRGYSKRMLKEALGPLGWERRNYYREKALRPKVREVPGGGGPSQLREGVLAEHPRQAAGGALRAGEEEGANRVRVADGPRRGYTSRRGARARQRQRFMTRDGEPQVGVVWLLPCRKIQLHFVCNGHSFPSEG